MPGTLNPSITSPRDGARARNKSPRDLTGRRHEELLRDKQARDAAHNVDLEAVKRESHAEGFSSGWDAGVAAILRQLEAEGVIEPDEPGEAE